jgi:hypothetical protein
VGRESVNVVACSPNSIWFRTAPLGGDRFTRALVREFHLTFAEAEKLKRAPWKARSMQQWDDALAPVSGELLDELRRSETILGRTRRIDRLYIDRRRRPAARTLTPRHAPGRRRGPAVKSNASEENCVEDLCTGNSPSSRAT